jgi:hypothetical protein
MSLYGYAVDRPQGPTSALLTGRRLVLGHDLNMTHADGDVHRGSDNRMSQRFIGGLQLSPVQNTTQPWVELRATADSLTLSLRFGFGRWWGPWIVKPEEVAKIKATDSKFFIGSGVEFHLLDGRLWTFWTFNPEAILQCLRQLGYPVTLSPS